MRNIIYIILVLLLSSCRVAQNVVESKLDEKIEIKNDVSIVDDSRLSEITDQIVSKIINEQLNIKIKQIHYDTDKPIDESSGKHPISEETEISINKQTDVSEVENKHQENNSIASLEIQDNSEKVVTTKQEIIEKRAGLKGWQKGLMLIGLLSIIAGTLYIINKTRRS